MSAVMRLVEFDQLAEWDRYVSEHPHGSIFHTAGMLKCQLATRDVYPFAYGAVNPQGKLVAVLVASRVVTSSGLKLPLAARSVFYAEPLADATEEGRCGLQDLVREHDRQMHSRVLFAEVRPMFDNSELQKVLTAQGYERFGYLNYEFDLDGDNETLFGRLGPKRRNNVRVAQRRGVAVEECSAGTSVRNLHAMLTESYAVSQLPMVDRSLFEAAEREWGRETYRVYAAYWESRLVAAACFLTYKRRVYCWFAGALRIPGVSATSLLFWEAIRTYAMEGYQIFDFAGGGWEGEVYGPGRFKAKFGGREVNHGRYRKVYSPWKLRVASAVYDQVRRYIAPRPVLSDRRERWRESNEEPLS